MILVHIRVNEVSVRHRTESVILEVLDRADEIMSLDLPQFGKFGRSRKSGIDLEVLAKLVELRLGLLRCLWLCRDSVRVHIEAMKELTRRVERPRTEVKDGLGHAIGTGRTPSNSDIVSISIECSYVLFHPLHGKSLIPQPIVPNCFSSTLLFQSLASQEPEEVQSVSNSDHNRVQLACRNELCWVQGNLLSRVSHWRKISELALLL
jgi:hypothetical protein